VEYHRRAADEVLALVVDVARRRGPHADPVRCEWRWHQITAMSPLISPPMSKGVQYEPFTFLM